MTGCGGPSSVDWPELKHSIRARYPSVRQISTEELAAWIDDPTRERPLLLDAREPEEFAISHLPQARLATDLEKALVALRDTSPGGPIVVYCSVGWRSSRLVSQLTQAGFANVRNLEGSLFEWANEERPIYRGTERVDVVHPYDSSWGRYLSPR